MKLLVTGRGTSGSWVIRGQQLGGAIGATVQANANKLSGFDLGIVVKRAAPDLLHRIRTVGLPVVYDVIDGWPQPVGNQEWGRDDCIAWLKRQIETIRPVGLVVSTEAMAADCECFKLPTLILPHHARPDQRKNPIRARVQKVGYEGAVGYLGRWSAVLEKECRIRKWDFVVNPSALDALDIVVAVRDCDGYPARYWKSNVKLANAQDTGTPCILDYEKAYTETASGGEVWVSKPDDVGAAFEELTSQEARQEASTKLQVGTLTLGSVAKEYNAWLRTLKF